MGDDLPLLHAPRYRSLDLWRGIACLMVVLHHAGFVVDSRDLASNPPDRAARAFVVGFFKSMDLGVPIFFVVSGYCIAAAADLTRRRGGPRFDFLMRRLRRIYPPYWAALLVFVVFTAGLDALGLERFHKGNHALELKSPGELDLSQWVGNVTLTESWRPHVRGRGEEIFTRIAWSLCYEEQFYVVCFVALLIAPRRLYAALAAITVATLLVRVAAWDSGWIIRFTGTFVMLWHEFAVGLAVYHRLNVARTPTAKRLDEGFLLLILCVALAVGYRETATAALFGLALVALRRFDDRFSESKTLRPLYACGLRCYSIYLVHLPVCVLGNLVLFEIGIRSFWGRVLLVVPIVSTAAVGFCWVFHAVVERRFLNPPQGSARTEPA